MSADMEGVTGLVDADGVQPDGRGHESGRSMMAEDVNAAVRGALAAGASDALVVDAHGPVRGPRPDDPPRPRAGRPLTSGGGPCPSPRRRAARPGHGAEDGRTVPASGGPPSLYRRFGVGARGPAVRTGAVPPRGPGRVFRRGCPGCSGGAASRVPGGAGPWLGRGCRGSRAPVGRLARSRRGRFAGCRGAAGVVRVRSAQASSAGEAGSGRAVRRA
ncbi:M55 family metallopeptidase [Streptomyces sp. KHY 26]|uniref:M55 family metallopeptidase n=1 Tax=Streptomyces sp. KHY 26 TaxID=3097359 RepID=UPI00376F39A0